MTCECCGQEIKGQPRREGKLAFCKSCWKNLMDSRDWRNQIVKKREGKGGKPCSPD